VAGLTNCVEHVSILVTKTQRAWGRASRSFAVKDRLCSSNERRSVWWLFFSRPVRFQRRPLNQRLRLSRHQPPCRKSQRLSHRNLRRHSRQPPHRNRPHCIHRRPPILPDDQLASPQTNRPANHPTIRLVHLLRLARSATPRRSRRPSPARADTIRAMTTSPAG